MHSHTGFVNQVILCQWIYVKLIERPASSTELAERIGCATKSIRRYIHALAQLYDINVRYHDDHHVWRIHDPDVDMDRFIRRKLKQHQEANKCQK